MGGGPRRRALPHRDRALSAPGPRRLRSLAILLVTAAVVYGVDHLIKGAVTGHIPLGAQVPESGPITIHHIRNSGAAFGLFPQFQTVFLAAAALVSLYIVLAGHRFGDAPWIQVTLGAILGGAVANAVDRFRQGYVVDYVDVHFWPVFNFADSCIVVGMLVAVVLFPRARRETAEGGAGGGAP